MRSGMTWQRAGLASGIAALATLLAAGLVDATGSGAPDEAGAPAFLQPERCYRLTFSIAGAPQWKVLERLDHGWIKAEIDAGPATAEREEVWVNAAQIITAREARCSG